jgi:hypothetical protein
LRNLKNRYFCTLKLKILNIIVQSCSWAHFKGEQILHNVAYTVCFPHSIAQHRSNKSIFYIETFKIFWSKRSIFVHLDQNKLFSKTLWRKFCFHEHDQNISQKTGWQNILPHMYSMKSQNLIHNPWWITKTTTKTPFSNKCCGRILWCGWLS